MKKLLKYYFQEYRNILGKLKKGYDERIELSRNQREIHSDIYKEIHDEYMKKQSEYAPYGWELYYNVEKILNENKHITIDEAIIKVTKSDTEKLRKEKIKKVATIRAYSKFMTYLIRINDEYNKGDTSETTVEKQKEDGNNKEFTTSRQVLAIHFLLKAFGNTNVDKTEQARFIQFLTSKEAGNNKIQNTTIYKKVCSPFKLNDNEFKKDLKYIKPYFEKLGMAAIVDMIDKEL